jgi:hypothetical protein
MEGLLVVEQFLEVMSGVMKSYLNISLLCSSYQQVRVHDFFGEDNLFYGEDILQEVEVTEAATLE